MGKIMTVEELLNYYTVRINADGKGQINGDGTPFYINDEKIDTSFFSKKFYELKQKEADNYKITGFDDISQQENCDKITGCIDYMRVFEFGVFSLEGWFFIDDGYSEKFIFIELNNIKSFYQITQIDRKDVCDAYLRNDILKCGFYTVVDYSNIGFSRNTGAICVYAGYFKKAHDKLYKKEIGNIRYADLNWRKKKYI